MSHEPARGRPSLTHVSGECLSRADPSTVQPRKAQAPVQRNWPAELCGSLSHTTATTSPGSITAHPVSRSRRTRPSGRTSTPVSFAFSVAWIPTWPVLLTIMEIDPDLPMRGLSRSRIVSPVISRHLQISLPAGCPERGTLRTEHEATPQQGEESPYGGEHRQ